MWSTRWSNPSGKAKVRFFATLLVVIFDYDDILMIIDCLNVVGVCVLDRFLSLLARERNGQESGREPGQEPVPS